MKESFLASVLFWCTFGISVGPFWTAVMEEARHSNFAFICRNYYLYLVLGWLPVVITIGVAVGLLGGISSAVVDLLYFPGAAVIFYLSWRVLSSLKSEVKRMQFDLKSMILLTWSNPKVWLVVPTGFLTAQYSDSLAVNIIVFYFVSVPILSICLYVWFMIGRGGAKIAKRKIGYFNSFLLALFGLYLLYQGVNKL